MIETSVMKVLIAVFPERLIHVKFFSSILIFSGSTARDVR